MKRQKPFTGKHAAIILVTFFGIVFAVNFTMAGFATSTFGGVVVKNSYVASQEFNGWLDKAKAQRALNWTVTSGKQQDGHLFVMLEDAPETASVTGIARHPLGRLPDQDIKFTQRGDGRFVSEAALTPGRWILRLEVTAGTGVWRSEEHIQ